MKDRPADMRSSEGLEGNRAADLIGRRGLDQPEHPHLGEILAALAAAPGEAKSDRSDQLEMLLHSPVAPVNCW